MIEIKDRWTSEILFKSHTATNLREAVLEAVKVKANLRSANLSSADLNSANLSSANLNSANLRLANLRSADLRSADLSSANLSSADLSSADLRSANLRLANLNSADLSSADLRSANLNSANLSSANLRLANLSSADLRSANLNSANLRLANLRSADLRSADLSSANLSSADLSSADLRSTKGILKFLANPLLSLEDQVGKIRAYKVVNSAYTGPQYPGLVYTPGETIEVEEFNSDPYTDCGSGINVATIDWCLNNYAMELSSSVYGYKLMLVEFSAKDIVATPYGGAGKFRVKKCKVIKELDLTKYLAVTD